MLSDMARPLRIEFAGALYHVISRGNGRADIVSEDHDRHKRLYWLQRTVETYGWQLHAFVLMNNHEHLFVETPRPNLSAGMQFLNGSYTSYFNRRYGRVGHLFQGRYKGHLIEEDGHFLEVSRYIHLNPVRAGLVTRPEEYRWSSYAGYRHRRQQLEWVTYGRVLGEFGRRDNDARRAYARFVLAGIDAPPPSPFARAVGGLLVGSQAFLDRIGGLLKGRAAERDLPELKRLRARPTLEQILVAVRRHFGGKARDWMPGRRSADAGRAVAACLARRHFGYSATATAVDHGPTELRSAVAALAKELE
jgi:REP element-mobilizing transposase RayT